MATRDVTTRLSVRDDLTPTLVKAASAADRLAASTDKAGRSVDAVAKGAGSGGGGLASLNRAFGDSGDAAKKAAKEYEAVGKAGMGMMKTGAVMAAGMGVAAKAAIDWDTAMTGVAKTVDGIDLGVLEGQLRGMARTLPQTHEEIAGVAEAAGQLGVKGKDVAGFTKVMLDMGQATNLSSEEAATSLARISNVMGTMDHQGTEGISRMAATVVALGNNAATTEGEIVAMATRISGAAATVGVTESQMLALASTMSSVGIEAELGGSAMSRAMLQMNSAVASGGDNLEAFARASGMSAEQLAATWKASPTEAIQAFVGGLQRTSDAGGDVAGVLKSVGLAGTQNASVFSRLANASGMLTDQLTLSGQAWQENSALAEEAQKRYDSAASQIKIAWNAVQDALIDVGGAIAPAISVGAKAVGALANAFTSLPGPAKDVIGAVGGVTAGVALLGGAALVAVPKIAAAKAGLDVLGISAVRAGVALKGLGVAAAAVATVVALDWGNEWLGSMAVATPATDKLAASLGNLAKGAGDTRAFMDAMGSSFGPIENAATSADDAVFRFGRSAAEALNPSLWDRAMFVNHAQATGELAAKVDQLDGALAQMVASGNASGAEAAMSRLTESAKAQGVDLDALKERFPQYAAAIAQAGTATSSTADQMAKLPPEARAAAEAMQAEADASAQLSSRLGSLPPALAGTQTAALVAAGAVKDFGKETTAAGIDVKALDLALKALMGGLSLEAALDGWSSGLQGVAEAAKKAGGDLDGTSAASIALRGAMRQQVEAGVQVIQKMAEQGATSQQLSAKAESLAGAIETTGRKANVSKGEMSRYTDVLRKVPAEVKTNVALTGAEAATQALRNLRTWVTNVDGQIVNIGVRVQQPSIPRSLQRPPGMATGGPVSGPGTATSDSILAALSNGEHVLTAAEVRAIGGHGAVERMRAMALAGGLPRFADGGAVEVRGYAKGGPTRGGYSITDKGLVIPITADVTKVIPPREAVKLTFDLAPADSAMLRGPELVSLLTGVDLPELDPAVKKVRDNYTRLIGILSSQVKDQAQLNEAVRKAQEDVAKARQGYASAVSGAASGATTASSTAVKGRASGALASSKAKPYLPQILAMGAKYGVAPELIAAVMQAESGFNPNAGSSAGARGLMQLMPGTFRGLGVKGKITDPNANIEAGTKYLSQMLAKVGGDVEKALRAYNAGPGAIAKSYKYKETNAYVAKIGRDAGVKSLAGSGRYGSSAVAGLNSTTDAKRAGEAIAKSQTQAAAVMKETVAQKTSPDTARAIAIQNALGMVGRGSYVWGGGHSANYYKNKAALNADCSGFVGWAVGNAVGKNVTGTSRTMLGGKAPNWVKIDPKLAARVAGAAMGRNGHIVMSMGDGTVTESYSKGKPVRRRKITAKDMQMAAWNTNLGPMTIGTAADITRGVRGTVVRGATGSSSTSSKTDPAAARQALADAEKALELAQQEAQLNTRRAAAVDQLKSKLVAALPQMESMAVAHAEAAENAKRYAEELEQAKKAQDDYARSIASSIVQQGELSKLWKLDAESGSVTSLQSVIADREKLVKDSLAFRDSVQALKAAGLNADDLADIIGMGAEAGGRLAQQILQERGSGVIADMNRTRLELQDAAGSVGADFGGIVYGDLVKSAGKDSEQAKAARDALGQAAWAIGENMQAEILRGLGLTDGALGKTTSDLLEQMKAQWLSSLGISYTPSAKPGAVTPRQLSTPAQPARPVVNVAAPQVQTVVNVTLDGQAVRHVAQQEIQANRASQMRSLAMTVGGGR